MNLTSVWNTVKNWLTGDITKDLASSIQLSEEDIQKGTQTEQVGDQEFVQDKGLLQFEEPEEVVYAPEDLIQPQVTPIAFDLYKDNSLPCLQYLNSLGYTTGMWMLNEQTHKDYDICDEYHGLTINLSVLIQTAQREAPIFTQSHVGCKCYILCNPPASPQEIPDNAPGLPINPKSPEEVQKRKEEIFKRLIQLPVYADSKLTFSISQAHSRFNRIKVAKQIEKIQYLVPVVVPFNIIIYYNTYLSQPLYQNSKGFLLYSDKLTGLGYVYLAERNNIFPISSYYLKAITNFNIRDNDSVNPSDYVLLDDDIGIVHRIAGDQVYCFVPKFETMVITDRSNVKSLDYA